MAVITETILENVLEKMDIQDEAALEEMVQTYSSKQPFVMMYLMEFNEEMESDVAKDDLVYLLLVVLECFYSIQNIALISAEAIMAEEENQMTALTEIDKITDEDARNNAAMAMLASEEVLFQFVGETLNDSEEEDESDFNEEDAGAIFGAIKMVVDLFKSQLGNGGLKAV